MALTFTGNFMLTTLTGARRREYRAGRLIQLLVMASLASALAHPLRAQDNIANERVGHDSATRLTRLGRDLAYGTLEAFAFAGVDQWRNDPPEWGPGGRAYWKRLASNEGEFVIQETTTEVLAGVMNRPVDYQPCPCHGTMSRVGWALHESFTDVMPNGTHPLAVPRIVGAYTGAFAQALWRPATSDRVRVALANGTSSLLIGAGIDLFQELRHNPRHHHAE